jgi:hypothetical protein
MAMRLPLYPHEAFGLYGGYLLGTLIGMAFGFVLERAGFGRARNLAAQFYLTDTRVLKVMFSAIVTACVGMALLAGVGLLDLSLITVPETFLWPQLVGGLLLGAGFIVSGYCPGTGVVAAASGNVDGAVAVGGVMLGSLAFGFGYGPLERFYLSGAMGVVRIDQLLGVPVAVVAAGVVAMAVGAFVGAEKLERIFARKAGVPAPASPRAARVGVFSGFAVVGALALFAVVLPRANPAPAAKIAVPIDAVALARQIVAAPQDLWLLDLRPAGPSDLPRIPGAMTLPADDADAALAASLSPTRRLVVYGEGDLQKLPAGVARYPGEVAVLTGGWNEWQAAVLSPPVPPATPTPALVAEFQLKNALHARFTGAAAAEPVKVEIKPVTSKASGPKKGGGC